MCCFHHNRVGHVQLAIAVDLIVVNHVPVKKDVVGVIPNTPAFLELLMPQIKKNVLTGFTTTAFLRVAVRI